MGAAVAKAHGLLMQLFTARTRQTREARAWAGQNARRLFAAGVCSAAALSLAAGVAPGIGWGLLLVGGSLAAEALTSRE